MITLKNVVAATSLFVSFSASASIISLDFEGVGNLNPVGNFYNGGAGTNYGVEFSGATLGLVNTDAGGTGDFANEPSPKTVMFFLDANKAILNFAAGFDTGFSFFYSSSTAASVNVYDGLNGTGNILATLALASQGFDNCTGELSGKYCNFTAVGVEFGGIAKSIDFGGTAGQIGFDNITFGTDTPVVSAVPVPAAAWLFGSALLGFAGFRRKSV